VRTIFAMGGGGFTTEPDNPALDEHILGLASKRVPKVCFLPTASGDAEEQLRRFYATYGDRPCEPTHVSLFRLGREPVDIAERLRGQDVVYVGGGSMRNMLAIWREHGLDAILAEAWRRGVVLAGLSAGAMCWFEGGISTSSGRPAPVAGLGLLRGSLSVHLDGEPERRPVYLDAVRTGRLPPGFAADDGVGLLFEDGEFVEAVSSRPSAGALRVDAEGTHALHVRFLGAGGSDREVQPPPFEVLELRNLRYRSPFRS
jgi:dipeptidase E